MVLFQGKLEGVEEGPILLPGGGGGFNGNL